MASRGTARSFAGRVALLPLAAAWALFSSAAAADVLILEAAQDNTLFEDAQGDTSSGSGPSLFAGRISQGLVRRALVSFDVRSALPHDALVDSVTLHLHLSSSSDPSPRAIRVHRVLADWGEGASSSAGGSGAPAQDGDATWLHTFYPGTFWASPGGDFTSTPSASTTVVGEGDFAWRSPELTADVQAWLAAGAEHGWIVIGEETVPGTARRFDSREHPTPQQRPWLALHYSMVTPAEPHTWGGLKHRYR
jgi:hypothetical protein